MINNLNKLDQLLQP